MTATLVPAWTLAVSEHSHPDYVYVCDSERLDPYTPGGFQAKLMSRMAPVRQAGVDAFGNPIVKVYRHERRV